MSEFTDGKLSGVTGTSVCEEGSDLKCTWNYFGIPLVNYTVLADSDPQKFSISYMCDDTKYKGWRFEALSIVTRTPEAADSISEEDLQQVLKKASEQLGGYAVASL